MVTRRRAGKRHSSAGGVGLVSAHGARAMGRDGSERGRCWKLPHTADVGLAAVAPSAEALLETLSAGFAGLLADRRAVRPREEWPVRVTGAGFVSVMERWLDEQLFLWETRRFLTRRARVDRVTPGAAQGVLLGERYEASRHAQLLAVKAVTKHASRFEEDRDGTWHGRVYLDI